MGEAEILTTSEPFAQGERRRVVPSHSLPGARQREATRSKDDPHRAEFNALLEEVSHFTRDTFPQLQSILEQWDGAADKGALLTPVFEALQRNILNADHYNKLKGKNLLQPYDPYFKSLFDHTVADIITPVILSAEFIVRYYSQASQNDIAPKVKEAVHDIVRLWPRSALTLESVLRDRLDHGPAHSEQTSLA